MRANRPSGRVSGNLYIAEQKRDGRVWYARIRLADGRELRRRLGKDWTRQSGRPPAGCFTRTTAQAALEELLVDLRRGTAARQVDPNVTFDDATAEWLRYCEHERGVKPSTLRDYKTSVRAYLLPAFGGRPLELITTEDVERWRSQLLEQSGLSRRTVQKVLTNLHGVFVRAKRVWHLPTNPVGDVERVSAPYSGAYDFYSPDEVWALVRATEAEQDAAIFLTAAFTGLRLGELLALRWRAVDFANAAIRVTESYAAGALTTPKSRRARVVPLVDDVAAALARLAQREWFVQPGDLVFPNELGTFQDGSALRKRYWRAQSAAGLRSLRFHDLRHTFGSLAIATGTIVEVQHWMGHSSPAVTSRYLHHRPRHDEAERLGRAFAATLTANPDQ